MALHSHLVKYVENRRAAGASTGDPIDLLIQHGDPDHIIVHVGEILYAKLIQALKILQTVLSIVFAGVINTGVHCELSVVSHETLYSYHGSVLGTASPRTQSHMAPTGHLGATICTLAVLRQF